MGSTGVRPRQSRRVPRRPGPATPPPHEARTSCQQRAGVQLKGGVGEAGDAYERHADAVADTVVAGGSAEALLSTMAGAPSGARAAEARCPTCSAVHRHPAQPDAARRRAQASVWRGTRASSAGSPPKQYIAMWEKEQGRKMTPDERATIDRGCIGSPRQTCTAAELPTGQRRQDLRDLRARAQVHVDHNKLLDEAAKQPGSTVGPPATWSSRSYSASNQSDNYDDRLHPG